MKKGILIDAYSGLLNPIPTGLYHVITVYGFIQPMAGINRVKYVL